jgi:hypothetical protein
VFAKLAVIIVAIGLAACGLLAMRQARLQAAHELAQAQLRIARVDERLLTLHAQIADRITPAGIRSMRERLEEARRLRDQAAASPAGLTGAPGPEVVP